MTSIARTPSLDVLLALCCVCGLPVDVLRRVVTWAWRVMLPSYVDDYDKAWNGVVCRDEYGESRGCYYTGD